MDWLWNAVQFLSEYVSKSIIADLKKKTNKQTKKLTN